MALLILVCSVDSFATTPNLGFYGAVGTEYDFSNEVGAFSNFVWIREDGPKKNIGSGSKYNSIKYLYKINQNSGTRVVVDVESIFFDPSTLVLYTDYSQRWAEYLSELEAGRASGIVNLILAFYPMDEAYSNGISHNISPSDMRNQMEIVARTIQISMALSGQPAIPLAFSFSTGTIDLTKSRSQTQFPIPEGYDYVGVDCYGSWANCSGHSMPTYFDYIENTLMSPNHRLFLFGDAMLTGSPASYVQSVPQEEQAISRLRSYFVRAQTDPRVVGIVPFIWQSVPHLKIIGTRDRPYFQAALKDLAKQYLKGEVILPSSGGGLRPEVISIDVGCTGQCLIITAKKVESDFLLDLRKMGNLTFSVDWKFLRDQMSISINPDGTYRIAVQLIDPMSMAELASAGLRAWLVNPSSSLWTDERKILPTATSIAPKSNPPSWLKDAIIYIMRLDRVPQVASNPIQSATAFLSYVADLGVTVVHVKPIAQIPYSFCSPWDIYYGVVDHQQIDRCLGSDVDFKAFVSKAHSLGLRVILDVIPHGVGESSSLVRNHPDWFINCPADNSGPLPPGCAGYMPMRDFDYTKAGPRDYWKQTMLLWVSKFNIDGFRADLEPLFASSGLWNEIASEAKEQYGTPLLLMSEGPSDHSQFHVSEQDFGVENAHGSPDFFRGDIATMVREGSYTSTFYTSSLSSHDDPGYKARGRIVYFAYGMLLAPVIPQWYMGEEFDNAQTFTGANENRLYFISPLKSNAWMANPSFLGKVKKLIDIRKANMDIIAPFAGPLNQSKLFNIAGSDDLPAYAMVSAQSAIVVVGRKSMAPGRMTLNLPAENLGQFTSFTVVDLMTDQVVSSSASVSDLHKFDVSIEGGGIRVFKVTGNNDVPPSVELPSCDIWYTSPRYTSFSTPFENQIFFVTNGDSAHAQILLRGLTNISQVKVTCSDYNYNNYNFPVSQKGYVGLGNLKASQGCGVYINGSSSASCSASLAVRK